MKILVVHNRYQQRGGEDVVFEAEVALLSTAGFTVSTFVVSNDQITGLGKRIGSFLQTPYSFYSYREFRRFMLSDSPDIVHVHNFFPLLTPAIFDVCRELRVPVVFTLHNYRITCANGQLLRGGQPCCLCIDGSPYSGVIHRCYRGSIFGSLATANMIALHRWRGTWQQSVNRFVALSAFARERFVAAGVPRDRIRIKPNFVFDPGVTNDGNLNREGILYVGRLSAEKGIDVLLNAWKRLSIPLTIVGSGPAESALRAARLPLVRYLGPLQPADVISLMKKSCYLVVPSVCYEQCPLVVIEAFSAGLPVIASRLGALQELVIDGRNGHLFWPGNPSDLASVVTSAMSSPDVARLCGQEARATYCEYYTPERNSYLLQEIYREVTEEIASTRDGVRQKREAK